METRQQFITGLTIQLDNPVHGTQFNGAPMLTRISMILSNGQPVFQQAGQVAEPAIASDLTPELVAAINAKLARLGYALTPLEAPDAV